VAASGRKWPQVASGASGGKWPQGVSEASAWQPLAATRVAASGRTWPLSAISISTLKATPLETILLVFIRNFVVVFRN